MRKILFLDIDGVLNSVQFAHYCNILREQNPDKNTEWRPYRDFDPMALTNLHDVVKSTGCEIVWSSTWRLGRTIEELNELVEKGFKRWGIDFKIPATGKTPCLREEKGWGVARGLEIERWLDENTENKNDIRFCILDDDSDMAHLKGFFVHTDGFVGLTWRDAEKVKEMLGEIDPWGTQFEDNGWWIKFDAKDFDGGSKQLWQEGCLSVDNQELKGPFESDEEAVRWAEEWKISSYRTFCFTEAPRTVVKNNQLKR